MKRLYIHVMDWYTEPNRYTYEVREPGIGTSDDFEPGKCLGVFDTKAEAQAFIKQLQDDETT